MLKSLVFLVTLIASFEALAEIGFSRGGDFTAVPIQGQVEVQCNGFNGTAEATFNCRDIILEPSAYDYFVGPIVPSTDKVELTAFHEDGSSRSRIVDYMGSKGMTKEALNLWISTLFQKPLLEKGLNYIQYRVYKGRNTFRTMSEGSFEVTVNQGAGRTCAPATLQSTDVNDCESQYSICQRYFVESKNCRK